MRGFTLPTGLFAGSCALVVLVGGCGSADDAAPIPPALGTGSTATAWPVQLPDLSRLADPVREQVREGHAALMRAIGRGDTPPGDLGDLYGHTGLLLMAAEYPEAAIPAFLNAMSLKPDDPQWPYYLGHLNRLRGEGVQAAGYFERAVALRPTDIPTLVWLGRVYLDQGRTKEAESVFASALPGSAAALAGVGLAALASGDNGRAVDHLERALAADPLALSLHYPLAMSYRGLGNQGRADEHLQRWSAGELTLPDPLMDAYRRVLESPLAFEARGVEAYENGDWATAAEAFRSGLELDPDHPSLRYQLATALAMAGDTPGAEAQFEETLRRASTYAPAHFGLGLLLESTGRRLDAIERFSAAVQYQPDYVEAHLWLAEALRLTGRAERSVPHYQRAVDLEPRVAEAWLGAADALIQLRRYEEARDWLTEAGRMHPERSEIPRLKESVEAILDLRRALESESPRP